MDEKTRATEDGIAGGIPNVPQGYVERLPEDETYEGNFSFRFRQAAPHTLTDKVGLGGDDAFDNLVQKIGTIAENKLGGRGTPAELAYAVIKSGVMSPQEYAALIAFGLDKLTD